MSHERAAQQDASASMRQPDATDFDIAPALRRALLQLAHEQENAAAAEAAEVPYWKPCPISVLGLRAAARVLRDAASMPSSGYVRRA